MNAMFIILIVAFPTLDKPMPNPNGIRDVPASYMSAQHDKSLGCFVSERRYTHTHGNTEVPI